MTTSLVSVETPGGAEERWTSAVEYVLVPRQQVRVVGECRQQTQNELEERVTRSTRHDSRADVRRRACRRVQELAVQLWLFAQHTTGLCCGV